MISLITAVLNEEKNIALLIESIRNQSSKNYEWVIVDGGSSDKTVEIIKNSNIPNVRLYELKNYGLYESINFGLDKITFDYYTVIGADDYIFHNAVELYNYAKENNNADFFYFNIVINGKIARPHKKYVLHGDTVMPSSHSMGALIRSELHSELGKYDTNFRIAADYDFIFNAKMANKNFQLKNLTIGAFSLSGISNRKISRSIVEHFLIKEKYTGVSYLQIILLFIRLTNYYINEKTNNNNCNKKF